MIDLHDAERRQRQLETLERLSQRFGVSLSEALSRSAGEGRRLDGVLAQLGRTLMKATARAMVKPLRSGLESLFQSLFSGEFARGAAFSRGMVTPFAAGGVVAAPTYFPMAGGRLGLMGERGAEAVMPLARGPDGRLGVRGGGGRPVQVVVNIATPDADSFRRSEAQVAAALARAVARGQRGL